MNKDAVIEILRGHVTALRARGVQSLYLFGSTARNEAAADSDVDLFFDYDAASRFSLIDLAGLKFTIEDLLSREADVMARDSLHPVLRETILAEAIRIF